MTGLSATTIWMGLGLLTAAIGIATIAWALFRDRSRGRRRCSSCWYDMSGTPGLRCPECGKEATTERSLFRTRRRWRFAGLGLLLLVGAHVVASVPDIQSRGWLAAVPRAALVLMSPRVTDQSTQGWRQPGPLEQEIRRRYFSDGPELKPLWPGEGLIVRFAARRALRPGNGEASLALGAELLAPQLAALPADLESEARARVALAMSAIAYARCTSYRDVGLTRGSLGNSDDKPFATAFERPASLRFEFLGFAFGQTHRFVVWGAEPDLHSWWTIDKTTRSQMSIPMAVSGPTGVSGGSAGIVPLLLAGLKTWVPVLTSTQILGTETFDGHDCLVIRGEDLRGLTCDVWLDAQTHMIRKIHKHWENPSILVFRPELNVPIAAESFEFDPSTQTPTPLGDRQEARKAFGDLAGDPRVGALPVPADKWKVGTPPGK